MRTVLVPLLLAAATRAFAVDDLRVDLEHRVALELEAARRTAAAEEHYRRGREFARNGQERTAAEEFRRAEAVILEADETAYFETSLRAYLHELRARIALPTTPRSPSDGAVLASSSPELPVDSRTLAWLRAALGKPM